MERKWDLKDSYEQMKFREIMLTNWCQKKFRPFAKQLFEISPYSDGKATLLEGLCYLKGWGVWRNRETAQKYFSQLSVGQTVWFGHYVGFMECEVVKIEKDRVLLREKNVRFMGGFGRFLTFPPKEAAPWDCCLARKWMNSDYFTGSFYKQERDLILKVNISTPANPFTDEKVTAKDTTDKVFPLSIQEYMEYKGISLKTSRDVICTFTREGPEAVWCHGDYITRITVREAEYKALYHGSASDDLGEIKLKGNKGSFFRTSGSANSKKAFVVKDFIFFEGEDRNTIRNSNIEIGYNPAFWVSLK